MGTFELLDSKVYTQKTNKPSGISVYSTMKLQVALLASSFAFCRSIIIADRNVTACEYWCNNPCHNKCEGLCDKTTTPVPASTTSTTTTTTTKPVKPNYDSCERWCNNKCHNFCNGKCKDEDVPEPPKCEKWCNTTCHNFCDGACTQKCEKWCNDPCNKFCDGACTPPNTPTSSFCDTFICDNPPCQIYSKAPNGYYSDNRDCRNFCFLSGHARIPSKFQRCTGGLVWDPSCNHKNDEGNSDLDNNQGCCNYVEDSNTSHCKLVHIN